MRSVKFEIPGEPKGKGRPRFAKRGNYVQTYTPDATANYENLVKVMYYNAGGKQKLEGPLAVRIDAFFQIPKSKSKAVQNEMRTHWQRPTIKCDVDNIAKIVLDGLNNVAFDDDKQVVQLVVLKWYDDRPRVVVSVREIQERSTDNV